MHIGPWKTINSRSTRVIYIYIHRAPASWNRSISITVVSVCRWLPSRRTQHALHRGQMGPVNSLSLLFARRTRLARPSLVLIHVSIYRVAGIYTHSAIKERRKKRAVSHATSRGAVSWTRATGNWPMIRWTTRVFVCCRKSRKPASLSHPRRHARADKPIPLFHFVPSSLSFFLSLFRGSARVKGSAEVARGNGQLFFYRWLAEKLAGRHNACDRNVAGHNETVIGREGFDGSSGNWKVWETDFPWLGAPRFLFQRSSRFLLFSFPFLFIFSFFFLI